MRPGAAAALLGLWLALAGCPGPGPGPAPSPSPSPPSLVWAEEAAAIWLQAVSRNDPRAAWEMLSAAARARQGSLEAFRSGAFPEWRKTQGPWAWPDRGRTSALAPEAGRSVVALHGEGGALAVPLVWEDGDWKVELGSGPRLSLEDRMIRVSPEAPIRLWVDGREIAAGSAGDLPLPPGLEGEVAVAWARGPDGAAAALAFRPGPRGPRPGRDGRRGSGMDGDPGGMNP